MAESRFQNSILQLDLIGLPNMIYDDEKQVFHM